MKISLIKFKIGLQRGAYLPMVLLMSTLFMAFAVALATLAMANVRTARHYEKYVSSLDIAEAGLSYYLWHLMHNRADFCDGHTADPSCGTDPNTFNGPYPHTYPDESDNMGDFDLYIKPPAAGEEFVTVKVTGRAKNSTSERTIVADIGMPSFSRYLIVANEEFWIGGGETTNGLVHSNAGVHFDGTTSGVVSASLASYIPDDNFGGDGAVHDGVWGTGSPSELWVFPLPAVDFSNISVEMAEINLAAFSGGIHLESLGGGDEGYYLQLNDDGTINKQVVEDVTQAGELEFSGAPQLLQAPANGLVFVQDDVWVDGTYDRPLTIAAEIPGDDDEAIIRVKDNLLYKVKDGSVRIGLVAEGNIEVPENAANNIEINAAMLSQKGHVWYPSGTGVLKNSITVYGSVSSFYRRAWTWVDNLGVPKSGYPDTTQTYDPFLLINPPPHFPTTGSYSILNWREIIEQ